MIRAVLIVAALSTASAHAQTYIARPAAENCSLAKINPDGSVTIDRACIDLYAKMHGHHPYDTSDKPEVAVAMKAILDGTTK